MDSFESRMNPRFLVESEKGMLREPRVTESGRETVEGFKEDEMEREELLFCRRSSHRHLSPGGEARCGGGATLANTGVMMMPHWPTLVWPCCHIGQHKCGGGATLANTGVMMMPHWPTLVWPWSHIGQHKCGGGATLANTVVVVVPHWPTQVWWWCLIGQQMCGGGASLANTGLVKVPHWPTQVW